MSQLGRLISLASRLLPSTRGGRLLTLIYHRVHAKPDPMFPGEVDAARFDSQMSALRDHCTPFGLPEAVARLRAGSLPPRAVAVTFDDGYADNVTVALPILKRYGIPATFFIAAGFLDGGRMWNDSVIEAIRRAKRPEIDLSSIGLARLPLGDWPERGTMAERILQAIKRLPADERARSVQALCDIVGVDLPADLMMSSAQVRALSDAGMTVGAHTMTHPILRTLSESEARAEIADSRDALQGIVGTPVRAFAYPNGRPGDDYTARDRAIVQDLGFDFAPCTVWGAATAGSDVYQLPRFTPWDRAPERWLARLLLAFRNAA